MAEKEKSVLEQFREAYPDCLEGFVEDVYVGTPFIGPAVLCCSIRQADISKPRITLLKVDDELYISPVGITKGHIVSVYIDRAIDTDSKYDGVLVALLNHNTGRKYETGESLNPEVCLKWEDVREPCYKKERPML
ncbi:MAG: hypothetical protein Q8N63_02205 [Nanoarchaeota archaeon]|nr:hypothetical protein [Nanoarchaeota archaeon]